MKQAKTKKNLLSILSAILGVVFAFITGVTYCISSFSLIYGTNPNSTSAYMTNQQYHVINDTVDHPVAYGEGSKNFEIALQYAMPYDFDVRFTYSLSWIDPITAQDSGLATSNVILHFANRDNIIYDENYIYLGESLLEGDAKITFITGVDFINTNDENYYGKALKINITNVQIYKKQTSYALSSHSLTKDVSTSVAAQAWIYYKNKSTLTTSYVMMYNNRRNHETGVPYPGLETAYKKPTVTSGSGTSQITKVSGPSWLGGNKAYAGAGMYIITGSSALKMKIEVSGIWRLNEKGVVIDASPQLISENSIKFNYTEDWTHTSWNNLKLWETRTYNFEIPAKTACYIEILDNIEVTSASRVASISYDKYRAVINSITINAGLTETVGETTNSLATTFEYTEANAQWLQMKQIHNNSGLTASGGTYKKADVSVVNSTLYSNGLYTTYIGAAAEEQYFETNISLINNTATTQKIKVDFSLMYYISNGKTVLTNADGNRAEEVYSTSKEAFEQSDLYYAYSLDPTVAVSTDKNDLTKQSDTTDAISSVIVTIAPYASVSVMESYSVPAKLQSIVQSIFEVDYDVWTYLVVSTSKYSGAETFDEDILSDDEISEGYTLEKSSLTIETTLNSTSAIFSVKNNSTQTIKGVHIKSLTAQQWSMAYEPTEKEPSDWAASYWKYYFKTDENSDNLTQVTNTDIINSYTIWQTTPDFIGLSDLQVYQPISVTNNDEKFVKSGSDFNATGIVLQPGESVVFARATLAAEKTSTSKLITETTKRVYVAGTAYSNKVIEPSTIALINNGDANAFLINNSDNSYYVRFSGNLKSTVSNILTDESYNHYIGVVRPGQIVSIPMTSAGVFEATPSERDGIFATTTISSWSDMAIVQMTKYFALIKTTQSS